MVVMMKNVRIIQYGVGSIGSIIARFLLKRRGLEVVGAIDIDERKIGRDLGEVIGVDRFLGVMVSDEAILSKVEADIVLHSTSSHLELVKPQIVKAIEAGMDVISTCEELAYPYVKHPEIALEIDSLAKKHEVTILGTGVNPGFVMDTLVLTLTSVCQDVKKVKVTRVLDASLRRLPLQRKVGAGLSIDEFKARVTEGVIGHVGLLESIAMVADGLGWRLDGLREEVAPVVAERYVESKFIKIDKGRVAGIRQVGHGLKRGEEAITLELQIYIGARESYDHILIEGEPKIDLKIKGGIQGDIATASIVINCIPLVLNAKPGLVTMRDLPIPSAMIGDEAYEQLK